jgi:hypothetical protein
MTATNHALTGAAIATLVRQPILAVPLAFASHFACDALPHFGLQLKFGSAAMWRYIYAETCAMAVIGISLLFIGTEQAVWLLLVGAAAAMSPDVAWYIYGKSGRQGKPEQYNLLNKFHYKIQWSETKWGIIPELFWAGLMISVILK